MCGIAGIWREKSTDLCRRLIPRMLDVQRHRGPDGEGLWIEPGGHCGLGHRRLAIIDPGESGRQPMTNEDESVWITFNGCIYNYQDLSRELRAKGHEFRTHCDTEVIIHAYEEWGTACLERFNGMFAFAIRDLRRDLLFCARDRLGIKPFYWMQADGAFAFSSEIKALLSTGLLRGEVDPDGLRQYLTFQFCLRDMTMFRGVHRLEPGHFLTISPGQDPVVKKYWDIDFHIDEDHDESWYVDQLRWLFEDAVRLRLRADVPLGAHLSGGLDSSTVASLARLLLGEAPIKTFTGAFREGSRYDESHYAKIVSKTARTDYHEVYLGSQDFSSTIEDIIWHLDEPAAGPGVFPQYCVSRLASDHVKVILGGQGGDEIFIGYARYLVAYLEECIKGAIENTAHRKDYVATLETIVSSLPTLEHYTPMLKHFWREGLFEEPSLRYFRLMDRFGDARKTLAPDLAARLDRRKTIEEFREVFEAPGAHSMINRILNFDTKCHLQSLLHIEDRTSMAWGLESRVPLLDHRLVEFVASVPPTIKFQNGNLKSLLRKAVRNIVPPEIFDRRDKMGFPVPLNEWIQGDLRDFVGDVLLGQRCRERGLFDSEQLEQTFTTSQAFSRSLWGALCLELWHRKFIDNPVRVETEASS